MKQLFFSLFIVVFALVSCEDDGDVDYKIYEVERLDLVEVISDLDNLEVNDTLWIRASFPNFLEYQGEELNISERTERNSVAFSFKLEKQDGFAIPSSIRFGSQDLTAAVGEAVPSPSDSSRMIVTAILAEDEFQARVGIILRASGSFLFSSFQQKSNGMDIVFSDQDFESSPVEDILLFTSISGDNENGKVAFEVR